MTDPSSIERLIEQEGVMELPEGWIAHDGLGSPVPFETRPAFMMRDGKTCEAGVFFGYSLSWRHNCGDGDVSRHTMERLASLFSAAIGKRLTYAELIA